MKIRRVVTFSLAVVLTASASSVLLAQRGGGGPAAVSQREEQRRNRNQQADVAAINQLLTTVTTAEPVTPTSTATDEQQGEVKVTWDMNHFIRGQGGLAYVPYSLTIDRSALGSEKVVVAVRAVSKTAEAAAPAAPAQQGNNRDRNQQAAAPPTYPWNDFDFFNLKDDGKVSRAMMLPAGEFDLFVVVKDQSSGDSKQMVRTGLLRKKLTVPDLNKPELTTSSILLGGIEELPSALNANQQRENPYTFGQMKVTPTTTGQFAKGGELALIFWVYGAGADAVTRRPNLSIEYSFYQRNADGTEKYFNKTAPQELNATTLPNEMDAAQGLPGVMSVPMSVFPAADYRLEIKVNDKAAGKTVVQNLNFTVSPS